MVLLRQPGMGHYQPPAIQHVVARQSLQEAQHPTAKRLRLARHLLQGFLQTMRDLDFLPLQVAHELAVMIAEHTKRSPAPDRIHREPQHRGTIRPAIHEVADKHESPPPRMIHPEAGLTRCLHQPFHAVAERSEQVAELRKAAVDIPDDIQRAMPRTLVAAQRPALDDGLIDLLDAAQPVPVDKRLLANPPAVHLQLLKLPDDDLLAHTPSRSPGVALEVGLQWKIEDYGDRRNVVALRQLEQSGACLRRRVGRVDHGQATAPEPFLDHEVQHFEGIAGCGLICLVVRDQRAEEVGGEHLGRPEVTASEGALAGARRTDQHHQRQPGHDDAPGGLSLPLTPRCWLRT
ncbi:hypothetical protein HRbin26_01995 [bacterium HR26]|nr:hypothetical protein HRbin26_01995 [bacterium HR26]